MPKPNETKQPEDLGEDFDFDSEILDEIWDNIGEGDAAETRK